MLIEEVVESDVKYVVIGRDSDGYQWEVDRGLTKEQAMATGASAAEEDVNVYGEGASLERTSKWSWRIKSPSHDYTAWFTIYEQDEEEDRQRELDDIWHDGIVEEEEVEEGVAWKKRGDKIIRQYRCVSGARKGRVVSSPGQCFKPIDIKKRASLRRTKAKMGSRATRKAQRTKRFNPVSKRVKAMNKRR